MYFKRLSNSTLPQSLSRFETYGTVLPSSVRFATTSTKSKRFGIAFDIDGVLLRGYQPLPRAKETIERLQKKHIPYIFLTNSGGVLEEEKAKQLTEILDVAVDPSQIILSHTPMQSLLEKYRDSRVLVMGSNDVIKVAKQYGFRKVVSVDQLAHHEPHQHPFRERKQIDAPHSNEEIASVLIFHDPVDWQQDLQIAVDVLRGGTPLGSGRACHTQTPLYVSNQDFVFSGTYDVPRFAQGAFTDCLKLLYERISGHPLKVTSFGKPHIVTYDFATKLLHDVAQAKWNEDVQLDRLYGIGDNPHADIRGANNAGDRWTSVLVRTGVFKGDNDPVDRADHVVDGVGDAIDLILEREGVDH